MNSQQNSETAGSQRLSGKVVLVTGAGTGIGKAAALGFAQQGAAVVLAGRREAELREVAQSINTLGGQTLVLPTDVSDEEAVQALVTGAVAHFGQLDAAFNNAGITGPFQPITELTASDFDRVMATNLRGVWLLIKYEVLAMQQGGRGGSIVNTSSFLSQAATVGTSIYSASKGALDSMIRAVALEVGLAGIRINNVNPGAIQTPMMAGTPDEVLRPLAAHSALGRLGEPEDVADVAAWLCSDEARFVTGQSILVDGGFTIAGWR
ncbi:SDR family NAD(P)-dependent oxidoreductase [Deinococcus marmoris]|uniref:D-beta-hydroxybutyrate dehydrogenase n=1 Tax=Deinococcus marmoris TaxID=249408 RepID=A0A1U7NRD2_9DEIO|nr:SDR family NAD(P)-dependent oxidoreductase [Deinococcus marmoris]OLV15466.1 D-beta-hydroxybutyrate dehydrogenase [Deinococcus marmoris]